MNQDEIAELEARLAALKKKEEEEKAEKAAAEAAMVSAAEVAARAAEAPPARPSGTAPSELGPEGFDLSTLSARKKVAAIKETPPEELLSEAWKESEGSQGEGGGIVPIIGGVVAAVALFAFAQVPVGGNAGLAPSAPPLPTAEQIRAKYAEVGALEAD